MVARDIAVENAILVWPRTASLTSIPPIRGRTHAVAGTLTRQIGDEGDVLGLRPYRTGDSLRHIHWRRRQNMTGLWFVSARPPAAVACNC